MKKILFAFGIICTIVVFFFSADRVFAADACPSEKPTCIPITWIRGDSSNKYFACVNFCGGCSPAQCTRTGPPGQTVGDFCCGAVPDQACFDDCFNAPQDDGTVPPTSQDDGTVPPTSTLPLADPESLRDTITSDVLKIKLPGSDVTGKDAKPGDIINAFMPYLFVFSGLILFIMIVWGGFEMLLGATDQKAQEAGKQRITWAAAGFLLLFLSYWIVQIIQIVFGISILG